MPPGGRCTVPKVHIMCPMIEHAELPTLGDMLSRHSILRASTGRSCQAAQLLQPATCTRPGAHLWCSTTLCTFFTLLSSPLLLDLMAARLGLGLPLPLLPPAAAMPAFTPAFEGEPPAEPCSPSVSGWRMECSLK